MGLLLHDHRAWDAAHSFFQKAHQLDGSLDGAYANYVYMSMQAKRSLARSILFCCFVVLLFCCFVVFLFSSALAARRAARIDTGVGDVGDGSCGAIHFSDPAAAPPRIF